MTKVHTMILACWMLLIAADGCSAIPDLRVARQAGPLTVYADDERPDLFYYGPGKLTLARTSEDKPDIHFLQLRYTGTVATRDRGTRLFRSILSFRVAMERGNEAERQAARAALIGFSAWRDIELRALPIRHIEAALVYATIAENGPQDTAEKNSVKALPPGHFEATEDKNAVSATHYWSERIYTLSLDENTAQIFWEALKKGQVVLSIGYAFYANGISPDTVKEELTGSPELIDKLRKQIEERRARDAAKGRDKQFLVRAGATSITLDAQRWPELLRRIDINTNAPPNYAILDLYCYDFNNALRADLYEKQVEIEAQGVTGRKVRLQAAFNRNEPDLYARSLRFPVAVRLDRPFRYRISEIAADGSIRFGQWFERASWAQMIDITIQVEASVIIQPLRHKGTKYVE